MSIMQPKPRVDGSYVYNPPRRKTTNSNLPTKTYPMDSSNAEANSWNTDPFLNEAVKIMQNQGINPHDQFGMGTMNSLYGGLRAGQLPTTPSTPTTTRGGGSGGSSQQRALQAMYNMWARPQDNTLIDAISRLAGDARTQGQDALSRLTAGLAAQQNPYANSQSPMPQVTGNPLAQYMQANGASTAQADALQQMMAATAQQSQAADQSYLGQMRSAWDAQQQARMSEAMQSGQVFDQSLANTVLGLQYQERQRQQQAKDQLMMQILQTAISNGLDLSTFGGMFR